MSTHLLFFCGINLGSKLINFNKGKKEGEGAKEEKECILTKQQLMTFTVAVEFAFSA